MHVHRLLEPSPSRRRLRLALACAGAAWGLAAGTVRAQAPADEHRDTTVVVARTVHPRIAYRALPAQDNPIHTEATTFPGQVFHGTLDRSLSPLVDDAELGQHGSTGLSPMAATRQLSDLLVPADAIGGPPGQRSMLGASSAPPMGPTASVGGAVTSATAGLGDLITGSVMQALSPQGNGR